MHVSLNACEFKRMLFISLQILTRHLMPALRKKRQHFYENPRNCILHNDNATPNTAMETSVTIDLLWMEKFTHPPNSPELAPCDFALFPHLKSQLRATHFDGLSHLKRACSEGFTSLSQEWYADVFRKWVNGHQRCIEHQGRYFEKEWLPVKIHNVRNSSHDVTTVRRLS